MAKNDKYVIAEVMLVMGVATSVWLVTIVISMHWDNDTRALLIAGTSLTLTAIWLLARTIANKLYRRCGMMNSEILSLFITVPAVWRARHSKARAFHYNR